MEPSRTSCAWLLKASSRAVTSRSDRACFIRLMALCNSGTKLSASRNYATSERPGRTQQRTKRAGSAKNRSSRTGSVDEPFSTGDSPARYERSAMEWAVREAARINDVKAEVGPGEPCESEQGGQSIRSSNALRLSSNGQSRESSKWWPITCEWNSRLAFCSSGHTALPHRHPSLPAVGRPRLRRGAHSVYVGLRRSLPPLTS